MLEIVYARTHEEVAQIRQLFMEYAAFLAIDLSFQDFAEELASLPGDYSPPDGRLLLAHYGGQGAGCVALRRIEYDVCEMKRMYVRPEHRGKGIGRSLAEAIVQEARQAGYARMHLDSLPALREAIVLYRSMGFGEIHPYRFNPVEGATFWELEL